MIVVRLKSIFWCCKAEQVAGESHLCTCCESWRTGSAALPGVDVPAALTCGLSCWHEHRLTANAILQELAAPVQAYAGCAFHLLARLWPRERAECANTFHCSVMCGYGGPITA